jgi:hypothetical protein
LNDLINGLFPDSLQLTWDGGDETLPKNSNSNSNSSALSFSAVHNVLRLIHAIFSSISAGCFLVGNEHDVSELFEYFPRVFSMWEHGAGGAVVAAAVLKGMCLWMSTMLLVPISSSNSSSTNNDLLKRDRSHRTKLSHFCAAHVMSAWPKLREYVIAGQRQQLAGCEDMSQDCVCKLLDAVKAFVVQCCRCCCDTSHFHSEKGPIGTINLWISPPPSAAAAAACRTHCMIAQVRTLPLPPSLSRLLNAYSLGSDD